MTSKEAFLALNLLPRIGPIRVRRLLERFERPQAILSAKRNELVAVPGIGEEMADQLTDWENRIDLAEEQRRISDHGISLLTLEDEDYPPALRTIYDPPFLLYIKGRILPADRAAIGVVGSRRTTHYGKEQAKKLSFQLAKAGFCIVSGLARGIDTAAHEAALAAEGRTLAVLGSGIGNVYPPENQALADRISEHGAVISEFPVLYVPDKQSFPLRNRIVAGISRGLLVVEAPVRSGSLITANQALEQGRTVFAVPGPIDRPTSEGCHRLIQQGATLVCSAQDIIDELDLEIGFLALDDTPRARPGSPGKIAEPRREPELSDGERLILTELMAGDATIDTLATATGIPAGRVSATLLQLELKSLVKQLPGKYFTKQI
ncbi:MAG: DNA-processing protein DprA [Verrucomicrobiales bacterium]|jgi:DNA processing protein|nr:DNA-processing protein DprA [Verrucomicrobiales bacterium]HQZ29310.1 DNA-processing protein DprA [Verrucomicrobiales bacterium]